MEQTTSLASLARILQINFWLSRKIYQKDKIFYLAQMGRFSPPQVAANFGIFAQRVSFHGEGLGNVPSAFAEVRSLIHIQSRRSCGSVMRVRSPFFSVVLNQ